MKLLLMSLMHRFFEIKSKCDDISITIKFSRFELVQEQNFTFSRHLKVFWRCFLYIHIFTNSSYLITNVTHSHSNERKKIKCNKNLLDLKTLILMTISDPALLR